MKVIPETHHTQHKHMYIIYIYPNFFNNHIKFQYRYLPIIILYFNYWQKGIKISNVISLVITWRCTDNKITKSKRTNNDLENITQKTKDRATQTLLKTGSELMPPGRAISSCSTWDIRRNVILGGYLTLNNFSFLFFSDSRLCQKRQYNIYYIFRSLHGIFQMIPFISPRSWYQSESR